MSAGSQPKNDGVHYNTVASGTASWKAISVRASLAVRRMASANPIAAGAIVAAASANIAAMAAAIYDVTGLGAAVAMLSAVTIITIQLGLISLTIGTRSGSRPARVAS